MKLILLLLITSLLLISCTKERIDLLNSILYGKWQNENYYFDFNSERCLFQCGELVLAGKYTVCERTAVIQLEYGSNMWFEIKHYNSNEIVCEIRYLGKITNLKLTKV